MKPRLPCLAPFLVLLLLPAAALANGRQPCDRGAGGIAYCEGERFICHNGSVSRSKRRCEAAIHGRAGQPGTPPREAPRVPRAAP
ncbi:MAG: hypothetical protein REI09_07840 [Candidatus Dactylopiibacterium sp.]|nr:hypothetical protein [Candidatus Dactylopiibacterium sp.]